MSNETEKQLKVDNYQRLSAFMSESKKEKNE